MNALITLYYDELKRRCARAEALEKSKQPSEAADAYQRAAETALYMAKVADGELRQKLVSIGDGLAVKVSRLRKAGSEQAATNGEASEWTPEKVPDISFDDVAGMEDVKRTVRERVLQPYKNPEVYKKFGLKPGAGLLLFGLPGTGKTTVARAIAHELNAPIFVVNCSDIVGKYLGEGGKRVKELFAEARRHNPCCIFFDEFEAIARNRSDVHDEVARIISQLLAEIDGFSKNTNNLLLLAATNIPWQIDPAFTRSGRFSSLVYVPLPDKAARLKIIEIQLRGAPVSQDIQLDSYADMTDGCNGSDLAGLCDSAKMSAIRRAMNDKSNGDSITHADFMNAFKGFTSSVNASNELEFREYLMDIGYQAAE